MILSFPDLEPTVTFIFPKHYNFGRCPWNLNHKTQLCLSAAAGRCQPGMGGAGPPILGNAFSLCDAVKGHPLCL